MILDWLFFTGTNVESQQKVNICSVLVSGVLYWGSLMILLYIYWYILLYQEFVLWIPLLYCEGRIFMKSQRLIMANGSWIYWWTMSHNQKFINSEWQNFLWNIVQYVYEISSLDYSIRNFFHAQQSKTVKPTASGVPRRSPIQVLTRPNVA